MKKLSIIYALFVILVLAGCRSGAPIENISTTIPSTISNDMTIKKMERIITHSALSRGWTVSQKSPGVLDARLKSRGHEVDIVITYNKSSYTITYKNSTNMHYNHEENSIHPKYNHWVSNLSRDIEKRIMRQTVSNGRNY